MNLKLQLIQQCMSYGKTTTYSKLVLQRVKMNLMIKSKEKEHVEFKYSHLKTPKTS